MARHESARIHRTVLWLGVLAVFVAYLLWALRSEEVFQVLNNKLENTDAGVIVIGICTGTKSHHTTAEEDILEDFQHVDYLTARIERVKQMLADL